MYYVVDEKIMGSWYHRDYSIWLSIDAIGAWQ